MLIGTISTRKYYTASFRRDAIKQVLIFASTYFFVLCIGMIAWSLIDIFIFDNIDMKFDDAWGNFNVALIMILSISTVSAIGNSIAVALMIWSYPFKLLNSSYIYAALISIILFLSINFLGVVGLIKSFFGESTGAIAASFFVASGFAGIGSLFIVSHVTKWKNAT